MSKQKKSNRKLYASVSTAALTASAFIPAAVIAEEGESEFPDVSTDKYYYPYVKDLYNAGIIQGMPNGNFEPNTKVDRAQASVMLTKILEIQAQSTEEEFSDVPADEWYGQEVYDLYSSGVIVGYGDGTFRPKREMSRAEFARLVVDAYEIPLEDNVDLPFTDVEKESWYESYVKTLYANDLIDGTSKTTFSPSASVKRGDFAKLLAETDYEAGSKLPKPGVVPEVISIK